ncbi:MAG: hypothetical protein WBD10_14595, partial [Acidobacteriaceae bacterium]
ELSSRHFTAAIDILHEVGKLDPSLPELEAMLQTASAGQEQERRRKLLEQVQAQIESCLLADDYDRATDLVNRAVEQLPTEASLLQLKTRVASQSRQFRARQLVDSTAAQAQEIFSRSPSEALQLVQRALEELPGEERLLTLESSLRQRLRALETEEVRGRYLREAQESIDHGQFDAAIKTLESYQLEFADAEGVTQLLEFARKELTQQQRRARIAACAEKARPLMQAERMDEAIALLDPVCAETGDASLSRLLAEAREQKAESARKLELLTDRVAKLRKQRHFDEAIDLLQNLPAAGEGAPLHSLLVELRAEQTRSQAVANAVKAANNALEKADFHAGLESLQSVRRAYGDSDELTRAIADFEAKRAAAASQAVSKSVDAARASLLKSDPAAAMNELRASAELVDFAGAAQQADWRRLKAEAAKPVARKTTGSIAAGESFEIAEAPASRRKLTTLLIAVALVLVIAVNIGLWWYSHKSKTQVAVNPAARAANQPQQPAALPTAPTGTLMVKGNTDNVEVFVDGLIKGFTQKDGTLTLPLDPGTHSVRFMKPGYDTSSAPPVTISAKKQAILSFNLTQSKSAAVVPETQAYLTIHSIPGAAVLINNSPQGKTDSQGSLILPVKPGKLSLQVERTGYQSITQNLSVKAGDRPSIVALLTPVPPPAKPAATPAPQPIQILSFSATDSQIESGQSTTLKWQTSNASEVSIDNGIDRVDASGQTSVRPSVTTTYTLTAKGTSGVQQRNVNVIVEPKAVAAAPKPTAVPKATPTIDEPALLQQVLNNFKAAYNAHDMARMRGVWTGMSKSQAHGLENFFKGNSGAKVQDDCPASSLSVTGESAQWACKETTTLVVSGRPLSSSHDIRFSFAKRNGTWSITERN